MDKIIQLKEAMIEYYRGDAKRIQHFIKVHSFAKLIGELEELDGKTLFVLESAALVHDIGIKPAEEKFKSCSGRLQEQEGEAPAREMLTLLNYDERDIDRICFLVAHHHTYDCIDSADYQILVEADFLVNIMEDNLPDKAALSAYQNVFRTACGKKICKEMFALKEE